MLKIRFARHGKKGQPAYKIVVANSTSPRDGKFIDEVGHYHPMETSEDKKVIFNQEKISYWVSVGAQPTDSVIKKIAKFDSNVFSNFQVKIKPKSNPKKSA